MPVRVACEHCDAKYQVREDKLGKNVRCQKCGETFTTRRPQPVAGPATAPASDDIDDFFIDTASAREPDQPKAKRSAGRSMWKIAGIIAGLFVASLLIGLIYAPAGMVLMMGWTFGGFGLIFYGIVRLFLAMEGRQRFWITLKILLRFVGLKLFYIDASLYNKKTLRAAAWMGVGFVLLFASFLPASHFLSQTRDVLQDDIARNEQKMDELAGNDGRGDRGFNADAPPEPFGQPPGGGFVGDPGRMPPPGAFAQPGMRPPPGFGAMGSPPVYDPEHPPGMFPSGAIPVNLSYESLDHPFTEIPARAEQEFVKFKFYLPRSVAINPNTKMIVFAASSAPGRDHLPQIYEAFARAGVKIRPLP